MTHPAIAGSSSSDCLEHLLHLKLSGATTSAFHVFLRPPSPPLLNENSASSLVFHPVASDGSRSSTATGLGVSLSLPNTAIFTRLPSGSTPHHKKPPHAVPNVSCIGELSPSNEEEEEVEAERLEGTARLLSLDIASGISEMLKRFD
ncbi:hypothetical protein B0H14DRAFT_2628565 [Mycena olivaceomarginata]|nr:hypothetical protein B0H14DRAFT_2628565 [Mycena olivaceomarginata]